MTSLNVEELKKLESDMIAMAKDFIMYGHRYVFFKTYEYPQMAIQEFGEDKLLQCWKTAFALITEED